MDAGRLIASLESFGTSFPAVLNGLTPADARWRPASGGWSLLEIVAHLADEEVADFRARLASTLADPLATWPPIDPEGWVRERGYQERDFTGEITQFVAEREQSVAWLRGLGADTKWDRTYRHPKLGPIRAGDLLVSWAAHDALHLRQIARRRFDRITAAGGEFTTDYAGGWTA